MLVAGAAMSLVAPLAVQASDVNLEGINDYSRSKKTAKRFDSKTFVNEVNEGLATLNGRIDALEVQQNEFEAGSFSDTTSLSGKAIFTVGGVENALGGTGTEAVKAQYTYQMNLNTSFTGDDDLYVRLKTGNGGTAPFNNKLMGTYLSSTNTYQDALKIDFG